MALYAIIPFVVSLFALHSVAFRLGKNSFQTSRKFQSSIKQANGLDSLIVPSGKTKFVFVGGKGGVGKTSTSSSIGLTLADRSLRTLIVSTDPAHSLGDALDVDLSSGKIIRIMTETNLWALEIDVENSLEEFKANANGLDAESIASSLGIPKEIVNSLGLDDLTSIFTNPPPGIDEIIALTKVFQYAKEKTESGLPRFDRIVIDTAPTGHTIRLLQLPEFLNSVTGKLIKLQAKITSAVNTFKGLFGGTESSKPINFLEKIEALQETLRLMKVSLKDPATTQFVVVTIPTSLAVEESKRLLSSLQTEGIAVSSIVCNQVISESSTSKYIETRRGVQRRCIEALEQKAQGLSESAVEITEVPYIDTEVMSIHGLRYFASVAHAPKPASATNPINSRKITIFGGKGGVGKTTSAASWGVRLADSGLRTLVVSTDPAHSLGDALQERLSGTPRLLDSPAGGGELWAMEVDPQAALEEFRTTLESSIGTSSDAAGSGAKGGQDAMGAMGLPNLKGELTSMLSGVNDPPPGTDEVVAMTKIVSYLEKGYTSPNGVVHKFDRVVLDTAPTGHTLRMLQLPLFLQQLMKKVRSIKDKTGGMMGMMGMMGGDDIDGGGNGADTGEKGVDKLAEFEARMERLEEMLHDPAQTEFTIVTIPTELATAETCRLITSLQAEDVAVRRMIINQVLPAAAGGAEETEEAAVAAATAANEAYLRRLRQGQQSSIAALQIMSQGAGTPLIMVPYFEMEVRTVYGLRAIGNYVFPPQ